MVLVKIEKMFALEITFVREKQDGPARSPRMWGDRAGLLQPQGNRLGHGERVWGDRAAPGQDGHPRLGGLT